MPGPGHAGRYESGGSFESNALSGRADQAGNAENPPFDLRHGSLGRQQVGLEETRERSVAVGAREPSRNAEGIVLIPCAPFGREAAAPQ